MLAAAVVLLLLVHTSGCAALGSNSTSCPLDLGYVPTFPWDHTPCVPPVTNQTACCTTLLSLIGIGLAARLRDTGRFRLPSADASAACLDAFSAALASTPLSLPASLVSSCLPSSYLAISPSYCAGVTTADEYVAAVGNAYVAELNSSCGSDLAALSLCSGCVNAGVDASARLTAVGRNASNSINCFFLTVLYAAGISNSAGPTAPATANCVLGLALSSPPSKSHHTTILLATTIAITLVLLLLLTLLVWRKREGKIKNTNHKISEEGSRVPRERQSGPRPNTGSVQFDIVELAKATDGFAERNLVGRGGFGAVYRGVLADGSVVAVKKMLDPNMDGGDEEFTNEVEIISHLRHRNLVPLRGCCIADDDVEEGKQRFLVYDFMPNGSLEQYIFSGKGGRPALEWAHRRSVVLDVARGLEYLHYGVKPGIYHRDIKATNILLDAGMRAQVADFGLARRSHEGKSHLTTRVAGTHGYLAPEYALYGQLTEKSDVYSFGVLVLEILSGRHALDMSDPSGVVLITDWAWKLVKAGGAREVVDKALLNRESPNGAMERFVLVGILCAHMTVSCRPTMPEALRMLEGDMDIPELPDRPLPYGHGIVFSNGGSNFSASPSPALSDLFMDFGDMLR